MPLLRDRASDIKQGQELPELIPVKRMDCEDSQAGSLLVLDDK